MLRIPMLLAAAGLLLVGCQASRQTGTILSSSSLSRDFNYEDAASVVGLGDRLIRAGELNLEAGMGVSGWSLEEKKRGCRPENLQLIRIEYPIERRAVELDYLVRDSVEPGHGPATAKYHFLWIRVSREGALEYSGFGETSGTSVP
jgi:hypothetical protein